MKLFVVIIITNFVILFTMLLLGTYNVHCLGKLPTVYPCHIHTMIKFVVKSFNKYPAKLTQ